MKKVIALMGAAGVGKTTIGNIFEDQGWKSVDSLHSLQGKSPNEAACMLSAIKGFYAEMRDDVTDEEIASMVANGVEVIEVFRDQSLYAGSGGGDKTIRDGVSDIIPNVDPLEELIPRIVQLSKHILGESKIHPYDPDQVPWEKYLKEEEAAKVTLAGKSTGESASETADAPQSSGEPADPAPAVPAINPDPSVHM